MSLKYAVLMWGVELTSSNNTLRFTRTTGVGASTWDARIGGVTPSPHANIKDWLPINNGSAYCFFKAVADAISTEDPNDDYTVTLNDGGTVTITNSNGNDFSLLFAHANTTMEPSWLGAYSAPVFLRGATSGGTRSSTTGAYTSAQCSSLIWMSPYAAGLHLYEANPRAIVRGIRTITGRSSTRRIAVRAPFRWNTIADQITNASLTASQSGGTSRLEIDSLEPNHVHRDASATGGLNRSLEVWWDHASQGKWFCLFEDKTTILAGTGEAEPMMFCRLLDQDAQEDYGAIVTQQGQASPRLFDVRMELESIDINHLTAGGA